MNHNQVMTALSRQMMNTVLEDLSTEEIIQLMRDGFALRSLGDKLQAAAPGYDRAALKKLLTEGMQKNHPDKKPDTIARNINNWFRGNQFSLLREYAIEISQILHLDVYAAERLLASVTDENLHLRSPEDAVLSYCLRLGLDYPAFVNLRERVQKAFPLTKEKDDAWLKLIEDFSVGVVHWEALSQEEEALLLFGEDASAQEKESLSSMGKRRLAEKQEAFFALNEEERWVRLRLLKQGWFTKMVREDYDDPQTEEELFDFLQRNQQNLGSYHNTAYVEMMRMLGLLSKPGDMVNGWGSSLNMKELLSDYLFTGSAARFKALLSKNDLLGKSIIAGWPEETMISHMIHRDTDVTRKVLILLRLATDDHLGEDTEMDDLWEDEGIELSREERFELYRNRMDDFLEKCGFRGLDPRVPFDWMILRCLLPPEDAEDEELWESETLLGQFLKQSGGKTDGNENQD